MGRRSAIEGWSLAAMAAVLMLGLPLSEARAGDLDDAAARQLGLAEADGNLFARLLQTLPD